MRSRLNIGGNWQKRLRKGKKKMKVSSKRRKLVRCVGLKKREKEKKKRKKTLNKQDCI